MTFINIKINNDTHRVVTIAEFDEHRDAETALKKYQAAGGYISGRSTQDWRDTRIKCSHPTCYKRSMWVKLSPAFSKRTSEYYCTEHKPRLARLIYLIREV